MTDNKKLMSDYDKLLRTQFGITRNQPHKRTFLSLFKKKQNVNKKEKIHYTPPRRIPLIGKKKLTPEQQRELFQLNEWILKAMKQDWQENNLK